MRILNILIFHGLTKPITGAQSRYLHLTSQLRKRGNSVVVLEQEQYLNSEDLHLGETHTYRDIKVMNRTLMIIRDANPNFLISLVTILRKRDIDLIQVSHPSGILAAKIISILCGGGIPVIYDAHNVETEFVRETFKTDLKYTKTERLILPLYVGLLEKIVCNLLSSRILSVSRRDKEVFAKIMHTDSTRIEVIPTGCVVPMLPTDEFRAKARSEMQIDSDTIVVIFHGYYEHPPNREAFEIIRERIAPRYADSKHNVRFIVGGTGWPAFEEANIRSVGPIKDLNRYLAAADIAVVPIMHGAGVKVKVFDYMSMGIPIVITSKAAEGILLEHRKSALIIKEVNQDFLHALDELISNTELRRTLGENARKIAEKEYDWEKVGEKLDSYYNELIGDSKMKSRAQI